MKLIFWGTPQFAVPSLERLIEEPAFDVLGVVTQPDRRRGRGKQLLPSAVKAVAQNHGLPVWQPASVKKDVETLAWLRSQHADAFVVVAYGQILSPEILALPRLGCINGHGSLLPAYRGAAPIQWALHDGKTTTGMTTMLMDAGMDTGDILLQDSLAIDPLENAHDLAHRLSHLSSELLVTTLLQLGQQAITPIPQNSQQATYARLIQKQDYRLDWTRTALSLHHQVRGFFPSCIARFRDQPLKLMATIPLDPAWGADLSQYLNGTIPDFTDAAEPGTVVHLLKNEGPIVQTGTGHLLLKAVQLSGKKRQSGWDFANGVRLSVGDIFLNG